MQFIQHGAMGTRSPLSDESIRALVFGHIMTQMTTKAAIKKHGRVAKEALMAEFAQLEIVNLYESINPLSLTKEQKRAPLGRLT